MKNFSQISVYIPKSMRAEKPLERLKQLALSQDRSLNYLIVEAILDYVNQHETAQLEDHRSVRASEVVV